MSKSILEKKFIGLLQLFNIGYKVEYKFHPERQWRFDFVISEQKKIAVEIEGGIFNKGRHTRGGSLIYKTNKKTGERKLVARGYIADCEKYNEAALLGWTVLRYTSVDLKARPEYIIEQIKKAKNEN